MRARGRPGRPGPPVGAGRRPAGSTPAARRSGRPRPRVSFGRVGTPPVCRGRRRPIHPHPWVRRRWTLPLFRALTCSPLPGRLDRAQGVGRVGHGRCWSGGGGLWIAAGHPWGARAIIHLVDRALERFFRLSGSLSEGSVDLSFDTPDRTWGAGLTRPTVNVFLWEILKSTAIPRAGMEQRRDAAGRIERRPVSPGGGTALPGDRLGDRAARRAPAPGVGGGVGPVPSEAPARDPARAARRGAVRALPGRPGHPVGALVRPRRASQARAAARRLVAHRDLRLAGHSDAGRVPHPQVRPRRPARPRRPPRRLPRRPPRRARPSAAVGRTAPS